MKQAMCILVAACAAMLVGCQESILVGPSVQQVESSAGTTAVSKAVPASDAVIEFHTVVADENGQMFETEGRVKFRSTLRPVLREDIFDLALDTEAKIKQLGEQGGSWSIVRATTQTVNLTGRTSAQVDERYFIRGGPNSMDLHLQFSVTAANVSLDAVTIE